MRRRDLEPRRLVLVLDFDFAFVLLRFVLGRFVGTRRLDFDFDFVFGRFVGTRRLVDEHFTHLFTPCMSARATYIKPSFPRLRVCSAHLFAAYGGPGLLEYFLVVKRSHMDDSFPS